MKLTVFGATGGIGGQVVRQALDAGHKVTAVARDPARLAVRDHPSLEVVAVAGLTDPEPLLPALDGSDAAISGVGPRSPRDVRVASSTGRAILAALDQSGVRRFVAVSAMPVGPIAAGESWANRRLRIPLLRTLLRGIYADVAVLEDEIGRSRTDWTVVRPPLLVNRPLTGRYRTVVGGNVPRGRSISRAAVAHLMLAVLDDPATVRQAVGIAR
ncbi:MAG: NAD(P)H-binding protein [Micromonosporaceae bacterium]|nr:NAD(P)H-binding protein [Micromonosporaceae bacterium]